MTTTTLVDDSSPSPAAVEKMHPACRRTTPSTVFCPRVLIIAEAANPDWVSVPLEGWAHSQALAQLAKVHLVTQIRNRNAITQAGLREGVDFTAIDSERVAKPLRRVVDIIRGGEGKGWTTVSAMEALPYYYFEQLVWKTFKKELQSRQFDLVHRITPLSPTRPSLLAQQCARIGVPFVMGPLNGGVPWPKQFNQARRREHEWLSYLRDVYKLLPGFQSTRRSAAAIIIGSRDTFKQMPLIYQRKSVYIPENAIDPARFTVSRQGPVRTPLQVAFLGRLVPYKGADMLLEAAAPLIRDGKVFVDIIGDGPQRDQLRQIVEREQISAGVRIDGWVAHDQVQHRLIGSDLFAFPSIREFGGAVVLEAMALGLTPLVIDYGGPAELVTAETGFKMPMASREQIVLNLRQMLTRISDDPDPLQQMGQRARQRVFDLFTWSAKARQTLEVYRWVLGERAHKPNFGMPLPENTPPLQ